MLIHVYSALFSRKSSQRNGNTDAALDVLVEQQERIGASGELWFAAELHRRCGDALWRRGDDAAARRCFEQALDVARGQGAKLWELQAATSYARMLRDQGKPAEAAALLAPVYAWFNEGFDTMPLRQARALLDELDRSVDEAPRTEARVAAFPR